MPKKNKPFRFVHCADLHLGFKQYGLKDRMRDFINVFHDVVEYMMKNSIKYLLISGDIFHKKDITPETLYEFETILDINEDITVIVVEGNHDNTHSIESVSWLKYLALKRKIDLVGQSLGNYRTFHNNKVRITGMPYYGASTKSKLEELKILCEKDIEKHDIEILMLHAGVLGVIPNTGNITPSDLMQFNKHFDCILLGHIHKPYEIENFIFNPGSLEMCSTTEATFKGGFYDMTISNGKIDRKHIETQRRKVHQLTINADIINKYRWKKLIEKDSIMEVTIVGQVEKKINTKIVLEKIKECSPLHVLIKDKTSIEGQDIVIKSTNREEIERNVINDLTGDQQLTELIIDIKNSNDDDETTVKKFYNYLGDDLASEETDT